MQDLLSKRRGEYNQLRRKDARNAFIVEKRRKNKVHQTIPIIIQFNQTIPEIQNKLIAATSNEERQYLINRLSNQILTKHKQISQQTLRYLFKILQQKHLRIQITNLLVNLTALKNIHSNLLDVIENNRNSLIILIQEQNNIILIQNLVYIIGNICGQDNKIKQEIINSNFFYELAKIVQINRTNFELINITLWSFKNLLLKNKNNHEIVLSLEFITFIIKFIQFLTFQIPKTKGFTQDKQFIGVEFNAIHLLKVVYLSIHNEDTKRNIYQYSLKNIINLLLSKLQNIINSTDDLKYYFLIIEIITFIAVMNCQYIHNAITKLQPLIILITQHKLQKWVPKNVDIIEAILQIIINSQRQSLFVCYVKNIDSFEKFLEYNRIRIIISNLYLHMSVHVKDLEKPKNELDFYICNKIQNIFKTIAALLHTKNNEIIYNAIRALSNIINFKDEPKQFKKILESLGISKTLIDLQQNSKEQIYEEVEKLLEQLDISQN